MTDNEIKTYLPFLAKYCKSEYNDIRVDEVLLGAFDIINRQNTEIDRLNKLVYEKHKENNKLNDYLQYAKADTVKEFAEKLKDRIVNFPSMYPIENATLAFLNGISHRQLEILEIIDDIVKEMAGDTE